VDDLTRQKESISTHLAQISQLLGTQMPGLADALKPAQGHAAMPATAPAPKAVAPGQAPAPVPAQAAAAPQPTAPAQAPPETVKQPVPAKAAAKAGDDEWWTE